MLPYVLFFNHSSHSMTARLVAIITILCCLVLEASGQGVDYDAKMRQAGLVDLAELGQGIIVDLKYASSHNFTGKNMYGGFSRAYLVEPAARALRKALKQLQEVNPHLGFIIYDAARPISVQRQMWNAVRGKPGRRYVAPPYHGGPHNYGVALDISLTYMGIPLDMGTPFDTFTDDAHITAENYLVKKGRISRHAMKARRLMRKVLTDNGFLTYSREWWHFEYVRVGKARHRFALLNF